MSLGGSFLVPAIRLPVDYGRLDELAQMAVELEVAGFIVFGGDAELTPSFLESLRGRVGRPLFVMADFERGAGYLVSGMPKLPPAMALGAARSPEHAYIAGKITALSAREVGVNVVLAPVMDVLTRPDNPIIGTRAFGDDPDMVIRLGLAFIEGVQEEGIVACAKHFPGHGDTDRDSHTALPVVKRGRDLLETVELPPFRAAARAGVGMIMTAHVIYEALDPSRPATFSRGIVKDLLRLRWGYRGLVVTDALVMEGARASEEPASVLALDAGIDLLLYPDDPAVAAAEIDAAVEAGRLDREDLVHRAGRVAIAAGDLVFDSPAPRDLTREYSYRIQEIARRALTLGRDMDGLLAAARDRAPGARLVGLVVDDDLSSERARAFASHGDAFTGGVVHVTSEGAGAVGDLAGILRSADLVVAGLFGDVRAAKERVGLGATLTGFVREVLREHAYKTLSIVFGSPTLAMGQPHRNLLFAYGDDPASLRAALGAVLEGGVLTGRLPMSVGKDFVPPRRKGTMDGV